MCTGQEEGWHPLGRRGGRLRRGAQPENHHAREGEEQGGGVPQLHATRAGAAAGACGTRGDLVLRFLATLGQRTLVGTGSEMCFEMCPAPAGVPARRTKSTRSGRLPRRSSMTARLSCGTRTGRWRRWRSGTKWRSRCARMGRAPSWRGGVGAVGVHVMHCIIIPCIMHRMMRIPIHAANARRVGGLTCRGPHPSNPHILPCAPSSSPSHPHHLSTEGQAPAVRAP